MESESVLLAAIGRLENKMDALAEMKADVSKLKEDMGIICKFKDTTIRTVQAFEDYKDTRKDLPTQILAVRSDFDAHCVATEDLPDLVKKHEKMATYGVGAVLTLNFILILLEAGRYIVGPTNWSFLHP